MCNAGAANLAGVCDEPALPCLSLSRPAPCLLLFPCHLPYFANSLALGEYRRVLAGAEEKLPATPPAVRTALLLPCASTRS